MITVCNLADASATIPHLQPAAIVSLLDPGEAAEPIAGEALLRLRFEDVRNAAEGSFPPGPVHVACLIAFARTLDPTQSILVHCRHGMGRSPAAAYILACVLGARSEDETATILRRRASSAKPNKRMVELADEIMGRDGRMIGAIRAMPRRRPEDRRRGPISIPEFPILPAD